jgi:hypothetical protein
VAVECTTDTVVAFVAAIAVDIGAVMDVDTGGPMPMDTVKAIAADFVARDTQQADITAGTMDHATGTVVPVIAIITVATGMDGPGGLERSLTPTITTTTTMMIITLTTIMHRL